MNLDQDLIDKIDKKAKEIEDKIIQYRRELHKNPELGLAENETSKFIKKELKDIGIPIEENLYGRKEIKEELDKLGEKIQGDHKSTGLVGILEGSQNGKTVLLRSDMDALKVTESKNEEHLPAKKDFRSRNEGIMHACGHDGHTAMLLGAAKALSEIKDQIKGRVKLIFQPAEEVVQGAAKMVEEGVLKDVDGIIIGIDEFDSDVIDRAENLKVISKYGTGLDNIDVDYASKNEIPITKTPTANIDAVADLTFGLIINLARRISEADRKMRNDKWQKIIGNSVWKKKLGVIGLGKIGKQVVKRAKGFNMKTQVYDVNKDEEFAEKYGIDYVSLNKLFQDSDYITIHTPLTEKTRDLISGEELKLMKDTSFIVNTSRGGIINEKALYKALKNNQIAGAALDAFVNEPPKDNKFKEFDNVILTPHIGGYTDEAIEKMGVQAARNLIAILEGREPGFRVN